MVIERNFQKPSPFHHWKNLTITIPSQQKVDHRSSLLCIIITGNHKYIKLGSVHQNQSIRISASVSGALVHCTRDYWAPVVPGLDYTTLLGAGYWLLGSGYCLLRLYPRMAASASAIHVFIPGKLNFLIAFLFLICSFAYGPIPFVVFYMLQ